MNGFLYDGDALMAELTPPGTFTHYYAHGANPGADDPLVWYVVGAEARWLHADRQGSIVAWTNSGPAQINRYDEWGIPAATNAGRFQYTGQAWLGELGMYHYKARIYSPTLGRFLQTDPVGYEDQMNLYAYVGNDPVNGIDPTGTEGACFYGPSQCGMIQLTPRQEKERSETASTLATIAVSMIPAERAISGLTWLGRALGIGKVAERAVGFASAAARDSHFAKHGREFGFKTASAYEKAAGNFLTGKAERGVMEGTRKGGDIVRFNPKTNEFGVVTKDGNVRTYFKPDPAKHGLKDNREYFKREIAR